MSKKCQCTQDCSKKDANVIAIEDLILLTVLTFCENAAELGCPRDEEVDMWFRNLSYEKAYKVAEKMLKMLETRPDEVAVEKPKKKGKKQ